MITAQDLTATEEISAQEPATPIAPARCSVPGSWCPQKATWMERNIKNLSKSIKQLMRSFGGFLSKTICTILATAKRGFCYWSFRKGNCII